MSLDALSKALRPLAPKEKKFVRAFLQTGNGARSARMAGYAGPNTDVVAADLMRKDLVVKAIEAGKHYVAEKWLSDGKVAAWAKEVRILSRSDVTAYQFDKDGEPIKEPGKEHIWRAVQSIRRKTTIRPDGTKVIEVEVKLWSKLEALRLEGTVIGALDGESARSEEKAPTVVVLGVDGDAILGLPAAPPDVVDVVPEGEKESSADGFPGEK